jgi:arabinofuranan 3-O-arabinosyltransferase
MTETGPSVPQRCHRSWLLLTSLVLTVAVILQQFGRIVPLTRTDRIMDPARFIEQNFVLWNPYMDMGTLPFSSIGFLFVFDLPLLIGQTIGLPIWLILRLMVAAVIVLGLWGFVRLLDELAIATPLVRLLGGAAYALTPMVLSRVGWRIGEAIAPAMLPWMLLPLVIGSRRGSPRRAAALSGLALAAIGGTNAAVALALVPIPALYLLTRSRGPRRAQLMRWWVAAVPMAVMWWMPLLVFLALFGGQLLKYSEQIGDTTSAATLFNVLRGSADWIIGLPSEGHVTAPKAISLAFLPALAVVVMTAAGLVGLSRSDMPERRFLLSSLTLGVVLIAATQSGVFANPLSELAVAVFGGPLEPFRNVYKLQALVTLPVIVGATYLVGVVARRLDSAGAGRRRVAFSLGMLVVVLAAAPIWKGQLLVRGGFERVPSAWSDVEELLETDAAARVIVVPGLRDAAYDWGRTSQIPLEWMEGVSWATRNQLPLNDQGGTQYLDAVELAIERGGDDGLQAFLLRGGHSHIVVANDGRIAASGAPSPTQVASALASSGLAAPVGFGPIVDEESGRRQIEVYRLGDASRATMYPQEAVSVLAGDAESVLQVPEEVFGERAFVLGDDPVPAGLTPSGVLMSDGNRRAPVYFGSNRNNRGYTLGPLESEVNGRPIDDLLYRPLPESQQTVRVIDGVREVHASSVGPGPLAVGQPVADPSNVIDGDHDTAWQPNRLAFRTGAMWGRQDPWVEITFEEPQRLDGLTVRLSVADVDDTRDPALTVTTDTGSVTSTVSSSDDEQDLGAPAGETTTLRVSIDRDALAGATSTGSVLGISELEIPGFEPVRRLRLPVELTEPTDAEVIGWMLTRLRESSEGDARLTGEGEIARVLPVGSATDAEVWVSASASRRADLIAELGVTDGLTIEADSTFLDRPGLSPRGLIDRSPFTRWVSASTSRFEPATTSVTLTWEGRRTIDEFRIGFTDSLARPTRVAVTDGTSIRLAPLGEAGWVRFTPLTTDTITITMRYDVAEDDEPATIGATGLEFPALDDLLVPALDLDDTVRIECDDGPAVVVDGVRMRYSLTSTWNDIFQSPHLAVEPCDGVDVELPAGESTVDAVGGRLGVSFDQIVLDSQHTTSTETSGGATETGQLEIVSWDATHRVARVEAVDTSLLVVNESYNRGWSAHLGDEELDAVRVDGWRQGFVVPAGSEGVVELTFGPNSVYRTSLMVGFALLAVLVALAIVPARRPGPPPVGAGVVSQWLVRLIAVGAAVWCAGVLAVFLPVVWWLDRRRPGAATVVVGGAFVAAGLVHLVVLHRTDGTAWFEAGEPTVTILAGLALVALLASSLRSETDLAPSEVIDP